MPNELGWIVSVTTYQSVFAIYLNLPAREDARW